MHFAAGAHQADDQRLLDRQRIGAEVMAGDDFGLNPDLVQIGAQPQAQRLDAQKIDLLAEQPARVIFAKAVGGDQAADFHNRRVLGFRSARGLMHENPAEIRAGF